MSILADIPADRASETRDKAKRVKFLVKGMTNELAKSWEEVWSLLWDDQNPQEVLDALGTDAGEVLDLHKEMKSSLSGLLGGRRPDKLNGINAKDNAKPNTRPEPDGRVTII